MCPRIVCAEGRQTMNYDGQGLAGTESEWVEVLW